MVNIDFSENVISIMKKRAEVKRIPQDKLSYLVMDARELQFADNSFESVIDKGKAKYI